MCGAWARARAGVEAQDTELDGEKKVACTMPDGTQVSAEEAEECAHHLVHPVYGRWPRHLNLPSLWCGTGMCAPLDTRAAVKRLDETQEVIISNACTGSDWSSQPRLD